MFKLVAADLDGTLLRDDKTLSAHTVAACRRLSNAGVYVVLATGRPLCGAKDYIDELGLRAQAGFAICANGAAVYRTADLSLWRLCAVAHNLAQEMYDLASESRINIQFLTEDAIYAIEPDAFPQKEADYNRIPLRPLRRDFFAGMAPVLKVMCIAPPPQVDAAVPLFETFGSKEVSVVRSAPYYLELYNQSAGKGNALSGIARHLGLRRRELLSFGDAMNDLDMLQYSGYGVAMGNADPNLHSAVDEVTGTNEQDGVAAVLDRIWPV